MKITLPNGERCELNDNLNIEDKRKEVSMLMEEWDESIHHGWLSDSIKYFLDSLSNYLVWHKEKDGTENNINIEDKYVMSRNKTNRLHRGRKDIPFSSLNDSNKEAIFGKKGESSNE